MGLSPLISGEILWLFVLLFDGLLMVINSFFSSFISSLLHPDLSIRVSLWEKLSISCSCDYFCLAGGSGAADLKTILKTYITTRIIIFHILRDAFCVLIITLVYGTAQSLFVMVTATKEIHDNNYYDTLPNQLFTYWKKGVGFVDNWSQFNQKYYL